MYHIFSTLFIQDFSSVSKILSNFHFIDKEQVLTAIECYIPFITAYNYELNSFEINIILDLFSMQIRILYRDLHDVEIKLQYDMDDSYKEDANETMITNNTQIIRKNITIRKKKRSIRKPFTSPKTIIMFLYNVIYPILRKYIYI